jgi:DNA invertase Pin-like site-specific DNA recombinase
MLIGYARVSTTDQNPELQVQTLKDAGCERLYVDKASGSITNRPELAKALGFCKKGDTLVCWKIDRVGRSLKHLLRIMEDLDFRGIKFRSLTQPIDTGSSYGKLIFAILGSVAEFEREMIRERTLAGLAAARARGVVGGRRSRLTVGAITNMRMNRDKGMKVAEICKNAAVSTSTYYRQMHRAPQ